MLSAEVSFASVAAAVESATPVSGLGGVSGYWVPSSGLDLGFIGFRVRGLGLRV